jgi:hypothetical protein
VGNLTTIGVAHNWSNAAGTEGIDDLILGRLPEVALAASVPRGFEKFDGIAGRVL